MNKSKKCAKCGIEYDFNGSATDVICSSGVHQLHQWVDQEPPKADKPICDACGTKYSNMHALGCPKNAEAVERVLEIGKRIEQRTREMEADERPWWMDEFEGRFDHVDIGTNGEARPFHEFQTYDDVKDFIHKTVSESLRRAVKKSNEDIVDRVMGMDSIWVAKAFHDFYESYAELKGWKTQRKCRVDFDDLPEENKATMICTASSVLREIAGKLALENMGNGEYCDECKCFCGCHPCRHAAESIIRSSEK